MPGHSAIAIPYSLLGDLLPQARDKWTEVRRPAIGYGSQSFL